MYAVIDLVGINILEYFFHFPWSHVFLIVSDIFKNFFNRRNPRFVLFGAFSVIELKG